MTVPSLEDAVGLDTSAHNSMGGRLLGLDGISEATNDNQPEDRDSSFLRLAQEAEQQAIQNLASGIRTAWARAYEAYGNKHSSGSKYRSAQYAGRSKLFRPKTRIAVRKKLREAASALFSTADVVSIEAEDESNPQQVASAALKQAIVNYRLRSKKTAIGIPWFLTALGALETATIAGVCASKQSWKYREDPDDGETLVDRPDIQLYPPENVLLDPNADWTNPVQTGQFVGLRNFYAPDDAWVMVKHGVEIGSKIPWLSNLTKETFTTTANNTGPSDTPAVRVARDGKHDPLQQASRSFKRVCLTEWFMRVEGREYVFWTIGTSKLISHPIALKKAYPEQYGERPITMGLGALEAFKVHPMAPVESWAPLQQEMNDGVNLRLDHMKQIIAPPTLVQRGKKVDLSAVQGRGPNRIIMVDSKDDVTTMPMSDTPQGAFQENNYLNADMDDLTGTMNTGTVQTNNNLNETVGGMTLMMGDSNAMAEYDLSIWVETWVAPTISQIIRLIERYEDDATILALCGMKAQLIEKFGINEITDKLLEMDTQCVIHVGIGASASPAHRLQKFAMAGQMAMGLLTPFVTGGVIHSPVPKVKTILDEVFGDAGFKDASSRFFQPIDDNAPPPQPQPPQPSPDKMAELSAKQQIAQNANQQKLAELQQRAQEHQDKMTSSAQDRQAKAQSDYIATMGEINKQMAQRKQMQEQGQMQAQHDMMKARIASAGEKARDDAMNFHSMLKGALDKQAELHKAKTQEKAKVIHSVLDHHAQAARAEQAHRHTLEQADAKHEQAVKLETVKAKVKPKPAGARPKPKKKSDS